MNEQNDEVAGTQQVVNSTDEVLSLLKDAETGRRGFLLTGREVYLQPYVAALADVPMGWTRSPKR